MKTLLSRIFVENLPVFYYSVLATLGIFAAFITFCEWWYTYTIIRWIYLPISIGFMLFVALCYKEAYKEETRIHEEKTKEKTEN